MSVLRGRYAGNPEGTFDYDIRQIDVRGLASYANAVIDAELSGSFWDALLPQEFDTSSSSSSAFTVYKAAQAKLGDLGFLSRDITVRDLLLNRSDVHHVFPRNHLKGKGLSSSRYNQVANFVIAQSEINISIGDRAPEIYFAELAEQCSGGPKRYGGITQMTELRANLSVSCLPVSLLDGKNLDFDDFLEQRRQLMAQKTKAYFSSL
jgi:hypothetical protein